MRDIDLLHPDFFKDPYPIYRQLREERPIYWDGQCRRWFITRYADVMSAANHPSLSSALIPPPERIVAMGLEEMEPVYQVMRRQMMFLDSPNHTHIRRLVHKAFTPDAIHTLRSQIESIAKTLLAPAAARGWMDMMKEFAYPLPAIVIAEMLGVCPEDRDKFKKWSTDFAEFTGNLARPPERLAEIRESVSALIEYLRKTVRRLQERRENSILSALVSAADKERAITEDELLANAVFLLAAGHETTTNLIANSLFCLLRAPDEMRRLRDDPSLLSWAIEEFLRYESPIQMMGRIAKEDVELGGTTIPRGRLVMLVLGSANRDPAQFVDPDRLDIGRRHNKHLSFGYGTHYCLGATLARVEAQIALTTVLRQFPTMRLAQRDTKWHQNLSFRGMNSLHVAFS